MSQRSERVERQRQLQWTALLAALVLGAENVQATPLDALACDGAKQEQATLADVPHLMERGPDWAKANATPETLRRIARWIELSEILSFRCGRGAVTAEAQRAAAAAELIENPPPPRVEGNANASLAHAPAAIPTPPAATATVVPANSAQPSTVAAESPNGAPPAKTAAKPRAKRKPKPQPAAGDNATPAVPVAADPPQPPKRKPKPLPPAADQQ